ncbi:BgTH12-05533 [Blumeria graminis f. sp. triticale]|uniref:BgTH12-05533 n=1 Tax=Blumeria graminis f. sp. triticale TaxID=1689686 RepID=A0A9W4D431_BLUGR|nr:BgTH12-05533 [Blumeria graminis f. sp. triticale]
MIFMNLWIPGSAILILIVLYKFIIYPLFLCPLSKIPRAHWSSSISPIWILWIRYRNWENQNVHRAHQNLGSIVRLGPYELSVNSIEAMRTVYSGGFEKGDWYSSFDNYGISSVPCMFSTHHSRPHSARKRMVAKVYSKSFIQSSSITAKQSQIILFERLLPLLKNAALPECFPNGIDIHEIWNATAMDFITAYIFGLRNSSNFLENEAVRKRWFHLYNSRKKYDFFPQELPRLTKFLKRIHINLVPKWVNEATKEIEAWTKELCETTFDFVQRAAMEEVEAENQPVVFEAIFSGIQKAKDMEKDSILENTVVKFPELSIASEVYDHLAAGHETSGITLTYLSWHLSQQQLVQDALRAELLTLEPNFLLSSSQNHHSLPKLKAVDELPLLHAVLMETLRQRTAIPGGQPRMTPDLSCSLESYSIPGNMRVGMQAYSAHRNAAAFPNPEIWDPMRWLDTQNGYTREQRQERDRWFWAFNSGSRMCIGRNFAMQEIKLIIAAVYTNFRTRIVDDEGIEQIDGHTCGPASGRLILELEATK